MPRAGTTTHGPGTRMHDWMPWHSFVAPPTGANEAATASATTIAASKGSHGNLLNQVPESSAPASMKTIPPAGRHGGHLEGLVLLADARAELPRTCSSRRRSLLPGRSVRRSTAAIVCSVAGCTGTWMRSV